MELPSFWEVMLAVVLLVVAILLAGLWTALLVSAGGILLYLGWTVWQELR